MPSIYYGSEKMVFPFENKSLCRHRSPLRGHARKLWKTCMYHGITRTFYKKKIQI